MKGLVAWEVLLPYPQFDKPFQVYADASDIQLGGIILKITVPSPILVEN